MNNLNNKNIDKKINKTNNSLIKYQKKLLDFLLKQDVQYKLIYQMLFLSHFDDRIIQELLNPIILEKNINPIITDYYNLLDLVNTKKNRIKFLNEILDLIDTIPVFKGNLNLYFTLDIDNKDDNKKNIKKSIDNKIKYISQLFIDLEHNFIRVNNNLTQINYITLLKNSINNNKNNLNNIIKLYDDLQENENNIKNKNGNNEKENNEKVIIKLVLNKPKFLPILIDKKQNNNDIHNYIIKLILPPLYKWNFIKDSKLYSYINDDFLNSIRTLKDLNNMDVYEYNLV